MTTSDESTPRGTMTTDAQAAAVVSTVGWGYQSEVTVHYVFYCPRCWRRYFAGQLLRGQVEATMYNAIRVGAGRNVYWKCSQCALAVERYPVGSGRLPEVPVIPEEDEERPSITMDEFLYDVRATPIFKEPNYDDE